MEEYRVTALNDLLGSIVPASDENYIKSEQRQSRLTKPPGSLGSLEKIANRFSSLSDSFPPVVPSRASVVIFAADHGVLEEGISPWPKEVTLQMLANFSAGGAAINVIAKQVGAKVSVVDIGVDGDTSQLHGVVTKKVRPGTENLAKGPAMSVDDAHKAIQAGIDVAESIISDGADLLVTGDMGIGNTTPSAALISWFSGVSVEETTGRGTGIDDERMAIKIRAIESAIKRVGTLAHLDPVDILAEIGGLEIAGICGLILAGAYHKIPVVLDGVIADAAAVVASKLNQHVVDYLFAGHLSMEPGAKIALSHLGLEPILKLDLRLGEGTGGCLSVPIIQCAVRTLVEMATFESAGVSETNS